MRSFVVFLRDTLAIMLIKQKEQKEQQEKLSNAATMSAFYFQIFNRSIIIIFLGIYTWTSGQRWLFREEEGRL